jgi:endonuclease/exonuclease/phosphatase (EEP) superfamily protein YafD
VRAARISCQALAAIPLLGSILHGLAAWRVFPQGSLLSGASYLPPSWLFPLVLPAVVGCWIFGARRICFALAAAYGVCVVPHSDFSLRTAPKPSGSAPRLSVMALNVQYYSFGVHNVVQAIKRLDADVALLSENVLDQAEVEAVSRELYPSSFRMGRSGETAIASKYPMRDFKEVELPTFQASLSGPSRLDQAATGPHRSFSHAVIEVDGIPVNVLSVRLIAGRAPAADLLSQVGWGLYLMRSQNTEVEFFKAYLARLKGPFIFGGDLNAPPSSPAVQALRERATDAYLATHLIGKPTFRVRAPLVRIDYVFASGELVPLQARRVDIEVSDHFPLFAEFQLPGPHAQARASARGEPGVP